MGWKKKKPSKHSLESQSRGSCRLPGQPLRTASRPRFPSRPLCAPADLATWFRASPSTLPAPPRPCPAPPRPAGSPQLPRPHSAVDARRPALCSCRRHAASRPARFEGGPPFLKILDLPLPASRCSHHRQRQSFGFQPSSCGPLAAAAANPSPGRRGANGN